MHDDAPLQVRFAGNTLDLAKGRLFAGSREIQLRPKSLHLLNYLVRASGRVVSKDELFRALWPDVTVTEDSLVQCVHEVRQALGPVGARCLRTIPRRGYLFEADTQATELSPSACAVPASIRDGAENVQLGLPPTSFMRRDGIAVMPFALAAGDPADAHLLDGLVHDVISRLARLRSFHVIARGSTFALRHLADDPCKAGRALGVAYVFNGVARIEAGRIRLQVDLVDASDGRILWTDETSGLGKAHNALIEDLADRLTQAVSREITVFERNRSLLAPAEGLDAWQSYHRGLHYMLRFTSDGLGEARKFFQRSIELNAAFARAHAGVSYCHFLDAFLKPRDARHADVELALRSASTAIELDELSPTSRWAYGRALWLSGDEDGGLAHLSKAIELSPSFAMGYQTLAFMLSQSGNPSEAICHAERAVTLSPHDPFLCAIHGSHAMALLRLGRIEEAATMGLLAARQHNVHKHILGITAIALAAAGREIEAREQVARIRGLDAEYDLTRFNGAFMRLSDDFSTIAHSAASRIGLA